jgi:hypothetical protein
MVKTRFLAFVPAAILAAACGGSSTPSTTFGATMNGASEVPPTTSTGTGTATYTIADTPNGKTVSYTITYSGLSGPPVASHIHVGAAGTAAAGNVVVPFTLPTGLGASGTFSGTFIEANIKAQTNPPVTTMVDLLGQIGAGNTYTNIHTTANGGGEIRGQNHP